MSALDLNATMLQALGAPTPAQFAGTIGAGVAAHGGKAIGTM